MANKDKVRPIKVLLIDDERDYSEQLVINARLNRIIVKPYRNHEEGFGALEQHENKFQAVILDARCFISTEDEDEGNAQDKAIYSAVNYLKNNFPKKFGYQLPFCVNTGFSTRFRENLKAMDVRVFDKESESEKDAMLEYLWEAVNCQKATQIKNSYNEVFEAFDHQLISFKREKDLLDILMDFEQKDYSHIERYLQNIRKFIEEIYSNIKADNPSMVPDFLLYDYGGINLWQTTNYLSGDKVKGTDDTLTDSIMPVEVKDCVGYLINVSRKDSHAHDGLETNYVLKSSTFALMAFILWYKSYRLKKK